MLQYSIKVSTGKRDVRLNKLRKSVGSFCMRCGLGWVLGGLRMPISSWVVSEKTLKSMFFGGENTAHCTTSLVFMIDRSNVSCRFSSQLSPSVTFSFWKTFTHCRDIVVQSYPTYVRFHVQTRIANKEWEMAEILTEYSPHIGLRNISDIFPFWKMFIHCRDISCSNLPYVRTLNFCTRKIRFAMQQ